jgi:hypothetical protein
MAATHDFIIDTNDLRVERSLAVAPIDFQHSRLAPAMAERSLWTNSCASAVHRPSCSSRRSRTSASTTPSFADADAGQEVRRAAPIGAIEACLKTISVF